MTTAEQIRALLPDARRFARALTGSVAEGDGLVERALETFDVRRGGDVRVDLYRLIVRAHAKKNSSSAKSNQTSPDRHIQSLPLSARAAYLLMNVEDCTRAETAAILDTTPQELDRQLAAAEAQMASARTTEILIIEDEPLIAMDLNVLAEELGHEVIGIARKREEALAAVKRQKPGLILADIELADGSSGVDAINDIVRDCEVPAIFVTAHPERALSGLRVTPAFLMAKPFRPEFLRALISQALFFDQRAEAP
jgi:CheY-like chemotaxis protein